MPLDNPVSSHNLTLHTLLSSLSMKEIRKTSWFKNLSFNAKLDVIRSYSQPIKSQPSSIHKIDNINQDNETITLLKGGHISAFVKDESIKGSIPHTNQTLSCNIKKISPSSAHNEIAIIHNHPSIYLGAFIDGKSILSGTYGEYKLPNGIDRNPIQIEVDLHQAPNSITATVDNISRGNINNAINQIINNNISHTNTVNARASIKEISMQLEAGYHFGFTAGAGIPPEIAEAALGIPVGVNLESEVKFDSSFNYKKKYFFMSINMIAYSANVSIESVSDLFSNSSFQPEGDALYVSSITYGRRILVLFETTSLDARFSGYMKSTAEAKASEIGINQSMESRAEAAFNQGETKASLLAIGSSNQVFTDITSFTALMSTIKQIATLGSQNYAPLHYTLSFLDGNGLATIKRSGYKYIPNCRKTSSRYKVTINHIKVEQVFDLGNDEEIYGDITAKVYHTSSSGRKEIPSQDNEPPYLFNKNQNQSVSIQHEHTYEINNSKYFIIPNNVDGAYFEISINLKDKIDFIEFPFHPTGYAQYQRKSQKIYTHEVGPGKTASIHTQEIGQNAELSVSYTITAIE